jgi:hypothetical protein
MSGKKRTLKRALVHISNLLIVIDALAMDSVRRSHAASTAVKDAAQFLPCKRRSK